MTTAKDTVFLGSNRGKYELRESLGRGGFAEVWKAYDPQLNRFVAVKLLLEALRQRPDFPEFSERFLREAQVMANLHHQNIVQIHDMGMDPGSGMAPLYLVMQYVDGPTLEDYLRRTSYQGRIPPASDIVHLFTALCNAVDYAHAHGVIHRDIKPRNILLDSQRWSIRLPMGEPMLADFGLVKLEGSDTMNTLEGIAMGTPLYLAPERAQGELATRLSDVYSLGIILYELCTGSYPYQVSDQSEDQYNVAILQRHITCSPIAPRSLNQELPPGVCAVLLRALAKDPTYRYATAGSMAETLAEAFGQTSPPGARLLPDVQVPGTSKEVPPSSIMQARVAEEGLPVAQLQVRTLPSQEQKPGIVGVRGDRHWYTSRRVGPLAMIARLALLAAVVIALVLGVWLGRSAQTPSASPAQVVFGTVVFLSSGQGTQVTGQGIDDIVQVRMQHLASPPAGRNYFAWLMSDQNQSDVQSLLLGRLEVQQGAASLPYAGDQTHDDLLLTFSRFLITEENTEPPPVVPTLNTAAWRYWGVIPQTPDPHDGQHFSYLNHLRHLLADDPALSQLGLPGGLSTWLFHSMTQVHGFTADTIPAWREHNIIHLRRQLIRALDYLDGSNAIKADVPPNTPFLANPTFARIGLLQTSQQSDDPPGYLVHVESHLTGLVNAPGGTQGVRSQAILIIGALDSMQASLLRVHADIRALLALTDQQILQPAALLLLSDVVSSINGAYGNQEGALWARERLQELAVIAVSGTTTAVHQA
jgi:eukaryotic-like serine/threonine-protein kinase